MNQAILAIIKHIAIVAIFAAITAGASAANVALGALDPATAGLLGGMVTLVVRLVDAELKKIDPTAVT